MSIQTNLLVLKTASVPPHPLRGRYVGCRCLVSCSQYGRKYN